ncbi:uncharacterized protein LOC144102716 [Amblyomma americanum]
MGLFLRTSCDVGEGTFWSSAMAEFFNGYLTLSPTGTATFQVSGGVLDFFVLFGNNPNEVVSQYARLVGLPPVPNEELTQIAAKGPVLLPYLTHIVDRELAEGGYRGFNESALVRDADGTVYTCRESDGSVATFFDVTHPVATREWCKLVFLVEYTEYSELNETFSIERPRCVFRLNRSSACSKKDVRMRPDDLCGDARLYISRYGRIRNAYVYLMVKGAYG